MKVRAPNKVSRAGGPNQLSSRVVFAAFEIDRVDFILASKRHRAAFGGINDIGRRRLPGRSGRAGCAEHAN